MTDKKNNFIEIPFGAKDSELGGFEYTIPKGFVAEIKDGKVIVKKSDSEDERIRKELMEQEIDFEQEIHKAFGQVKDFTLCVNIAKHFYDEGYFDGHIHAGDRIEHVDGRRVNVSRFRRVAKPLEAHVSGDLEETAKEKIIAEIKRLMNNRSKTLVDGSYWDYKGLIDFINSLSK